MFRGREMTHPERGRELLLRLAEDVKGLGLIESQPLQDGRNMVMMLGPAKAAVPVPAPGDEPAGDEPVGNEPVGNEPEGNEPEGDEAAAGG
jgi:translation initiation factor IF-3